MTACAHRVRFVGTWREEFFEVPFSQETLAEMIGTTRSRVSFFMNKFRKLGFINYNGKLEVHNSLLNVVLHDKPEIKTRDEAIDAE
jgi:CRP/FNR family transcriptional regulator, cyclic AMP receptor protein